MGESIAEGGLYRIPALRELLHGTSRELDDAVPPLVPPGPLFIGGGTAQNHAASAVRTGSLSTELSSLVELLQTESSSYEALDAAKDVTNDLLPSETPKRYGWVAGWLQTPDPDGFYAVEFVEKRSVRILAYLDKFGRAFTTDKPLELPPAREPDMKFVKFAEQADTTVAEGGVEVRSADGTWREVARFRSVGNRFALFDSWFNFAGHADNLPYAEAIARCYFAFVHRPSLGAPDVPARGLDSMMTLLDGMPALPALRKVEASIVYAQRDAALRPPSYAKALANWLAQAGLDQLALAPSGSLRLVRTVRFADIFYLAPTEEGAGLPMRVIWCLQNALNRYLLGMRALGARASLATTAEVLHSDEHLVESVASRSVKQVVPELPSGETEWDLRHRISLAIERIAAPLRFEVEFRLDVDAGVVAFKTVMPDESMMPQQRWDPAKQTVKNASVEERVAAARRYAMHLALFLAATVFFGNRRIERVEFSAHTLWEEGSFSLGDVLAAEGSAPFDEALKDHSDNPLAQLLPGPDLYVAIERQAFLAASPLAINGDPTRAFSRWGAELVCNAFCRKDGKAVGDLAAAWVEDDTAPAPDAETIGSAGTEAPFDAGSTSVEAGAPLGAGRTSVEAGALTIVSRIDDDPFDRIAKLPSASLRRDLPEYADSEIPFEAQEALGAQWAHDLRIDAQALHRRHADQLAGTLAKTDSTLAAIEVVRKHQSATDDPLTHAACLRLMEALALGSADPEDQNTVVRSYLGVDGCREALLRAKDLVEQGDTQSAAKLLSEAAWQAEATGNISDNQEVVYRSFDGYASRVVYNLVRQGSLALGDQQTARGFGEEDRDRRVELAPDALLHCHMEAAKLLERSFDGIDAALIHAKRAVELAPSATPPRCLLARVYMLIGDTTSAIDVLKDSLLLATQPNEIAVAYYQLAYVLWKSGRARAGAACYMKSISASPIMATQAALELQDLLAREGIGLPARADVEPTLKECGVPIAPVPVVLDALFAAAKQAVDANLFVVGRSLLATCLVHRPDDSLMGVYRSLLDLLP